MTAGEYKGTERDSLFFLTFTGLLRLQGGRKWFLCLKKDQESELKFFFPDSIVTRNRDSSSLTFVPQFCLYPSYKGYLVKWSCCITPQKNHPKTKPWSSFVNKNNFAAWELKQWEIQWFPYGHTWCVEEQGPETSTAWYPTYILHPGWFFVMAVVTS